jgi:ABC-2 type transport system ATP-binding protein
MKEMISISKLDFRYGGQSRLLSNLDLKIDAGKVHGLFGINGEGKSTLLKLISGAIFPLRGEISVLGFVPKDRKPKMLQDVFFLTEEFPETSISIKLFTKIYAPFYPKFSIGRFQGYLNEFALDNNTPDISKLSYGQKKKFWIAFGLATNSKIIMLDEPTNGLDIPSKGQFRRMIDSVKSKECCIIISSHQVLDLENIIDNIIIMDNHDVLFNASIRSILKKIYFKEGNDGEVDEVLIYKEDTREGLFKICENKTEKESKLNIELLFNAAISQKVIFKNLFAN